MEQLFTLFHDHPSIHGITLWGYTEKHWQSPGGTLRKAVGTERPALTWLDHYLKDLTFGY